MDAADGKSPLIDGFVAAKCLNQQGVSFLNRADFSRQCD